jgi:hypothetical protein
MSIQILIKKKCQLKFKKKKIEYQTHILMNQKSS